jgi:ferric enterobactin receptor
MIHTIKQGLLVLSLFLIGGYCFSQERPVPHRMSGRVVDSISHKPMPFVTVKLTSATDTTTRYTLTDSIGIYSFGELPVGNYIVKFSMAGYSEGQLENIKLVSTIVIKDFFMLPVVIELASVTITARRMPISPRIDGFSYDASRDRPVAGETASDLLRKLPAVIVSPEGSPTIRGSSAIKVFIDGRPSEAYANSITEALKQVPSENISRIEVITQPSARYDAEGVDAVILIFTKKPLNNGISGAANAQASNLNASITNNLNIRHGKWLTNIGAGYYYNNNPSGSNLIRTEGTGGATSSLVQQRDNRSELNSVFAAVNVLRSIDSLSSWNAGYRYGEFWGPDVNMVFNRFVSGSQINEFSRNIDNSSGIHTNTLNAGYVKKSGDRKTELNILGLYFYQKRSGTYVLEQTTGQQITYRENSHNKVDNQEIAFQADLTKETMSKSVFETGVKASYRDLDNSNNFGVYDTNAGDYLPDNIRSNTLWFRRAIIAGYVSYLLNLDKWTIRTGIRYEHTLFKLEFSDAAIKVPDYKNFLQSLLISRSFQNGGQFSIGYSKKLLRPYIAYMNPVVNYTDSLNLEFGNPNLRPVITHALEGAYSYTGKFTVLSLSAFINQNKNSIENIRTLNNGGFVESTYLNVASNLTLGGIVSLSFRSGKWSANTNHNLRYITYKSPALTTPVNGTVSSHYLNAGYKIDPSFSVEVSGSLNAGQVNYQSTVTGSQWYSLLISKTFSQGKTGISVRLDNIATPTQYVTEKITGDAFQQNTQRHFPLLLTRLAFFYKIGKKEVQTPSTRRIGNDN